MLHLDIEYIDLTVIELADELLAKFFNHFPVRDDTHIHFLRFLEDLWNHLSQATSVGPLVLHKTLN